MCSQLQQYVQPRELFMLFATSKICRNALKAEPSQMQELIVQPRESLRTCVKQQLQRDETRPHNLQKSISGDWVKQRSADTKSQLNHCKS